MLLNTKGRMLLLNLLPAENNFRTWKTVSKLKEALYFSEDEVKALDFKTEPMPDGKGTTTTWNEEADKEIEVEIGELATEVMVSTLERIPAAEWTPDVWWLAVGMADSGVAVKPAIVKALKELDETSKLTQGHLALYERFVEDKKAKAD